MTISLEEIIIEYVGQYVESGAERRLLDLSVAITICSLDSAPILMALGKVCNYHGTKAGC